MKIGIDNGGNWTAEYYEATVVSVVDYYPFGSAMAGRKYNQGTYRYGFNGMEKDDEVKGEGNSYDFGARLFDSRVGRWLAVDPLAVKYPSYSPYNGIGNNPIVFIDPDGKDVIITRIQGGGEDGKDLIIVTVNAKIVDNTTISQQIETIYAQNAKRIEKGKPISKASAMRISELEAKQRFIEQEMASEILKQMESAFSGKGENIDWKFDTENSIVEFASTSENIRDDDYVFYIEDNLYNKGDDDYTAGERATAALGGRTVYFSLGSLTKFKNNVFAHEIGHLMGLLHPDQNYRGLLNKKEILSKNPSEDYKVWKNTFFNANLMLQGAENTGTLTIEEHQVLNIEKLYTEGMLNKGGNSYDSCHNQNQDIDYDTYSYKPNEESD